LNNSQPISDVVTIGWSPSEKTWWTNTSMLPIVERGT
jgi:hypothetical protein